MAKSFYFWQDVSGRPNGNPATKVEIRGVGNLIVLKPRVTKISFKNMFTEFFGNNLPWL
jgi:hypothetical protein